MIAITTSNSIRVKPERLDGAMERTPQRGRKTDNDESLMIVFPRRGGSNEKPLQEAGIPPLTAC
jgi:hypothetical protein